MLQISVNFEDWGRDDGRGRVASVGGVEGDYARGIFYLVDAPRGSLSDT